LENPPDGWTRLVLASRLVLGLDCEDAVVIEGERHLDLRHVARPLVNGDEIELAEQLVVPDVSLPPPTGWFPAVAVYFSLFRYYPGCAG
jgi:hypothetical protein